MLQEQYRIPEPAAPLTDYRRWGPAANFGIENWGNHVTMDEAKEECFGRLLKDADPELNIIEGFTLSFAAERRMTAAALQETNSLILRLDLPFEEWALLHARKFGLDAQLLRADHNRLTKCFEPTPGDKIIEYSHPSRVSVSSILTALVVQAEGSPSIASEPFNLPDSSVVQRLHPKITTRTQSTNSKFFSSFEDFKTEAMRTMDVVPDSKNKTYWANFQGRWEYHKRAIALMKSGGVSDPSKVLELGTMGCSVVRGSDTMDYAVNLEHYAVEPDYLHDCRFIPWPIKSDSYEWFVALRVFHHLWPVQREAFEEARRIAKNVLIVVPTKLVPDLPAGLGVAISPGDFRSWNSSMPPLLCEPTWSPGDQAGNMLFWWQR